MTGTKGATAAHDQGGAALAARFRGLSADHLEYVGDAGVAAMAAAGTVAVLLPGALVISAGGVNSGIFQMMVGRMLQDGDLSGLKFTLANAMKDLRYYTHLAEGLPTSALLGEAVHQTLVQANLLGFGDKYIASLMEAQEKLAGVTIVRR